MSLPHQEGERDLVKDPVTCLVDGRPVPDSMIVLTDRRIVLLVPRKLDLRVTWTRPLLRAIAEHARVRAVAHEIARHDFVAFETRSTELTFRGKTDAFTVVASATPAAVWRDWIDRWVAGTFGPQTPAPLPTARVIKR